MGVDFDFGAVEAAQGLIDLKVMKGTRNFAKGPAMTKDEATKCVESGIELAAGYAKQGYKMIGTGDMGIGNTTPSSAIAAVITGAAVSDVTGRGTGISDETLVTKVRVIEDAIRLNKPDAKDGIDVLAKVGGTEIGGIAGLILGAAANRIPIVIDGLISTAGALVAYTIQPAVRDYIFAAHNSVEKGHRVMLAAMELTPILDLGLRLGEGTGAALAMLMIEAGLKIYNEMATFEEAGVSEKIED
jgi:nicotinate-nucleotide--dimethylbenzimidazole phosphoribosyltransferase